MPMTTESERIAQVVAEIGADLAGPKPHGGSDDYR
jgi:hypothetical protein